MKATTPTPLHLVMHGVAIKKHGDRAQIAAISGLPEPLVTQELAWAVTHGRIAEAGGRYLLTPAGQMILLGEYSRFCGGLRGHPALGGAYARFELINRDLKQIITDWQTMEIGGRRIANDHANREHDARVIDRLGDLHERCEPILKQLVTAVPRLDHYARGLTQALERAEAGETAWVSEVKIDSYHTVWFELHEELLRLMGRQREE
jgi:hypothetical protein